MTVHSIANYGDKDIDFFNLICMGVGFLVFLLIHSFQTNRAKIYSRSLDQAAVTPLDYSIEVKGVGTEVTKEDLKNYFEEKGAKVTEIEFAYSLLESKRIDI